MTSHNEEPHPLRFLLDENVDAQVAEALHDRGIEAVALTEWQSGRFLSSPDADVLRAAAEESRVLVTYDVHMSSLLVEFGEHGEHHAGVVFVSPKSISQSDVGTLVRALERLATRESLENTSVFLTTRAEDPHPSS